MRPANYDTPNHQPKTTTHECGCVVTEGAGHTHVKFCGACRVRYFADCDGHIFSVEPNNLDLIGG
jgi:hypothetical protein